MTSVTAVSIFELWWRQRGFTFQSVSFYLSFQALVTSCPNGLWRRTQICHTHGICVPPLLTLQTWNRTRPVEGFRLYRLGTTWSLKSCVSVLELIPRISVLNYYVFPLTQQSLVNQVLLITEASWSHSSCEWTACRKDLYPTAHNSQKRNIYPCPWWDSAGRGLHYACPHWGREVRQNSSHLCPQEYTEHSCDCLLLDSYT